jgi:hypothetical protein
MTIQRNSKKRVKSSLPNRRLNLLLILTLFQVLLLSWFIWLTASGSWNNRGDRGQVQSAEIDHTSSISRENIAGIQTDEQLINELNEPSVEVVEREEALSPMQTPVRIEVLNGTGISKLAWRFSQGLIENGVDVLETSNADRPDYEKTRIICRSNDIRQANHLAQLLRFPSVRIEQLSAPELVDIDVTLILGADYQQLQIPR